MAKSGVQKYKFLLQIKQKKQNSFASLWNPCPGMIFLGFYLFYWDNHSTKPYETCIQ
jgi:hypothetical protein